MRGNLEQPAFPGPVAIFLDLDTHSPKRAQIITAYNNSTRFSAGEEFQSGTEVYEQRVFRDTLLTFGQCPYIVAEQAIIRGEDEGLPHGKVDLIAGSEIPSSPYVVCMVASSRGYTTFSEPNGTTVKTPFTFGVFSSHRQAVVELFATSTVQSWDEKGVDRELPVIHPDLT